MQIIEWRLRNSMLIAYIGCVFVCLLAAIARKTLKIIEKEEEEIINIKIQSK